MNVALYARVSTDEQNPIMQRKALEKYAVDNGFCFEYFEEKESTRKTRPVKYGLYHRLLKREFDMIVVWKLDRWARSLQELSGEVKVLYDKGVMFVSLKENIDLSSATGRLQFNIFSAFAEFERDMISERTKEGLKHAKNVGKRGKDRKVRKKGGYYLRYVNKGGL
jgi:DNA invertase Pin-like site-specific DNA recombinase